MEEPGICVVDDDPSVLRSLWELLGSDGFDAQIFDSPERFMDYARTHSVRLAVLDVWMPTHNGIRTAGAAADAIASNCRYNHYCSR
jgi:FixJ family two-component response regulator